MKCDIVSFVSIFTTGIQFFNI